MGVWSEALVRVHCRSGWPGIASLPRPLSTSRHLSHLAPPQARHRVSAAYFLAFFGLGYVGLSLRSSYNILPPHHTLNNRQYS